MLTLARRRSPAPPVFVTVSGSSPLVPMGCDGKLSGFGLGVACGSKPMPVRA